MFGMRKWLPIAAVAAVAAVPAQSATGAERIGPAGASTAVAPFDQQFIDTIAAHHQVGIDMAEMTLTSARHEKLRSIGRGIIAREQRDLAKLRVIRKRDFGSGTFKPYPAGTSRSRQIGMNGLMAVHEMMDSPHFDHVFLGTMIAHHATAIALADRELTEGTSTDVKAVASALIRSEATEIGTMIALRVAWYGS